MLPFILLHIEVDHRFLLDPDFSRGTVLGASRTVDQRSSDFWSCCSRHLLHTSAFAL